MQKIQIMGKSRYGTYQDAFVDPTGRMGQSYNFRGATETASSTVTRNDETEIMGAVSGQFTDIVTVMAANSSTNAINLQLRSGRGSGISANINAAANVTTLVNFPIPLQANEASTPWTVSQNTAVADSGDSPVTVTLIAIKTTD